MPMNGGIGSANYARFVPEEIAMLQLSQIGHWPGFAGRVWWPLAPLVQGDPMAGVGVAIR